MAFTTHCPSCNRLVKVPDELLGRQVRCPGCRAVFTTQADEAPAAAPRDREEDFEERTRRQAPPEEPNEYEEEEYEEEERPRRRRRSRSRRARDAVMAPAIALLVTGILGILAGLGHLGLGLLVGQQPPPPPQRPGPPGQQEVFQKSFTVGFYVGKYGPGVLSLLGGSVIILGAVSMMRLSAYGFAMFTAVFAMLPCHCSCLLGLPFGIWAMIVLNRPEVRNSFG
jgi:hypothetical protein